MQAIITTASFRRSDNRHMVTAGRRLYDVSDEYAKELIRVGLARECSDISQPPRIKSEPPLVLPLASSASVLPAVLVLPQTTLNESDNVATEPISAPIHIPNKRGRKKKNS